MIPLPFHALRVVGFIKAITIRPDGCSVTVEDRTRGAVTLEASTEQARAAAGLLPVEVRGAAIVAAGQRRLMWLRDAKRPSAPTSRAQRPLVPSRWREALWDRGD